MKFFSLFIFVWLMVFLPICQAILPEEIGGTQYATGYLAAAEKRRGTVMSIAKKNNVSPAKASKFYDYMEKFLLGYRQHDHLDLKMLLKDPQERVEFLRIALQVQEADRALVPKLVMIGDRGMAVDGHHRIRTSARVNQMIDEAYKIWPKEMIDIMTPMKRVNPDGSPILFFDYKKINVVSQLPEDATAADVVRELLNKKKGLWKGEEQLLAQKFYGPVGSQSASVEELKKLGASLGIEDDLVTKKVSFKTITDLPDSPVRTIIGNWFDSRYLKLAFNYKDYAEFYVGDEVVKLVAEGPGKYPAIERFIRETKNGTVASQKPLLKDVLLELDGIFNNNQVFRSKLTQLSQSPEVISQTLMSVHLAKNGIKRNCLQLRSMLLMLY